jgi:hypothetical protein
MVRLTFLPRIGEFGVSGNEGQSGERLVEAIDAVHARIGRSQREFLSLIGEIDRREAWQDAGARDTAHWLAMRYGVSSWKAHRFLTAAHALDSLPRLSEALCRGELGIDKVLELARFASPETEAGLIAWARQVSLATVRRRGDLAARVSIHDDRDADRDCFLSWWYLDEGRRLGLEAELPAAQGAIVVRALERVAATIPPMPDEQDHYYSSARRADALVSVCSAAIARDPDPDRATVVVHAQLDGLQSGSGGCEIEHGPVVHPETVRRLLCNARTQVVLEDRAGNALGLGRMSREPPAWMARQVRYRDRGCRFPGCGTRAFTEAHHVRWWRNGGRTDLANLLLICSFHHRLVHEHGWSVRRDPDGALQWFRPDGIRYQAGPSPGADPPSPVAPTEEELLLATAG